MLNNASALSSPGDKPASVPTSTRILQSYQRALLGRAFWLTRDRDEAADLVQDAFERALRSGAWMIPAPKLFGWLQVTLQNLFLDECRSCRKRLRVALTDAVVEASSRQAQTPWGLDDEEPAPRWNDITIEMVRSGSARLPLALRAPLMLWMSGRSYADIAAILRIPVRTVGTRIFRARRCLRHMLSPEPPVR
jgi:RNA polymerase sigma-70 factor (ECF subfamily)